MDTHTADVMHAAQLAAMTDPTPANLAACTAAEDAHLAALGIDTELEDRRIAQGEAR